jgi:hypothetical protein
MYMQEETQQHRCRTEERLMSSLYPEVASLNLDGDYDGQELLRGSDRASQEHVTRLLKSPESTTLEPIYHA